MTGFVCVCSPVETNVVLDAAKARGTVQTIRETVLKCESPVWIKTPRFMAMLSDQDDPLEMYPEMVIPKRPGKFVRPDYCLFTDMTGESDTVFVFMNAVNNTGIQMPKLVVPMTKRDFAERTVEVVFEKVSRVLGHGFVVVEVTADGRIVRLGTRLDTVIAFPSVFPELTICVEVTRDEAQRMHKRIELVNEIVETEREYVSDLYRMMRFWKVGFMQKNMLNEQDLDLFFKDIPGIIKYHEMFLAALKQVAHGYASELGGVFAEYAIFFKVALPYITSSQNMMAVLTQKSMIRTFAVSMEEMVKENGGRDFLSYLVAPVKRLPKYNVFLTQLVTYTPSAHPDAFMLPLACEKIAEVNSMVDEAAQVQKGKTILAKIQDKLRRQGETAEILGPSRRIISKANVTVVKGRRTTIPAVFYLCNDIFFVFAEQVKPELIVQCEVRSFHYINSPSDYRTLCIIKFVKDREKVTRKEHKIIFDSSEDQANIMNKIADVQREYIEHVRLKEKGIIWSLDPLSQSVTPICHHACVGNGRSIVFFGGLTTDYRVLSSDFSTYGYEPNALENAPISTITVSDSRTAGRYKHTLTYMNNNLYIVGGIVDPKDRCYVVEFNLQKNMYINSCKAAIIDRYSHTCTAVGNKLYLFGGKDKAKALHDDILVIDPTEKKVVPLKIAGEKPPARCCHSAVLYQDKIVVFGGKGQEGILNDLWSFDLRTNTWEQKYPSVAPAPRRSHLAFVFGANMLIIGGISSTFSSVPTMSINLSRLQISYVVDIGNFPMSLRNSSGAVMMDQHIILYGGMEYGSKTPLNCIFRLELSSNWAGQQNNAEDNGEAEVLDGAVWDAILNMSCCNTIMSHKSTWVPAREARPKKGQPLKLSDGTAFTPLTRSQQKLLIPRKNNGRASLSLSQAVEQSRSACLFHTTPYKLSMSADDDVSEMLAIEKTSEDSEVVVQQDFGKSEGRSQTSDHSDSTSESSKKLDITKILPRPRTKKNGITANVVGKRAGRHRSHSSRDPRRRSYGGSKGPLDWGATEGKAFKPEAPLDIYGNPLPVFSESSKERANRTMESADQQREKSSESSTKAECQDTSELLDPAITGRESDPKTYGDSSETIEQRVTESEIDKIVIDTQVPDANRDKSLSETNCGFCISVTEGAGLDLSNREVPIMEINSDDEHSRGHDAEEPAGSHLVSPEIDREKGVTGVAEPSEPTETQILPSQTNISESHPHVSRSLESQPQLEDGEPILNQKETSSNGRVPSELEQSIPTHSDDEKNASVPSSQPVEGEKLTHPNGTIPSLGPTQETATAPPDPKQNSLVAPPPRNPTSTTPNSTQLEKSASIQKSQIEQPVKQNVKGESSGTPNQQPVQSATGSSETQPATKQSTAAGPGKGAQTQHQTTLPPSTEQNPVFRQAQGHPATEPQMQQTRTKQPTEGYPTVQDGSTQKVASQPTGGAPMQQPIKQTPAAQPPNAAKQTTVAHPVNDTKQIATAAQPANAAKQPIKQIAAAPAANPTKQTPAVQPANAAKQPAKQIATVAQPASAAKQTPAGQPANAAKQTPAAGQPANAAKQAPTGQPANAAKQAPTGQPANAAKQPTKQVPAAAQPANATKQPTKQAPAAAQPANATKQTPAAAQPANATKQTPAAAQPANAAKQNPAVAQPANAAKQNPAVAQPANATKQAPAPAQPANAAKQTPTAQTANTAKQPTKQAPAAAQPANTAKQTPAPAQTANAAKQTPTAQTANTAKQPTKQAPAAAQPANAAKQAPAPAQPTNAAKQTPTAQTANAAKQNPAVAQPANAAKQTPAAPQQASGIKQPVKQTPAAQPATASKQPATATPPKSVPTPQQGPNQNPAARPPAGAPTQQRAKQSPAPQPAKAPPAATQPPKPNSPSRPMAPSPKPASPAAPPRK